MRRPMLWAALIVVGLALLWLVLRRGALRFGSPSSSITVDPHGKPVPAPLVDPSTLPPPTNGVNVAFDVQNGDTLERDFMIDDVQFNKEGPMWTDFMQPAGRVRQFADLTTKDWQNMFGLLAMTLQRQDGRSRRWQQFNSNMYDQEVGQAVDSVVGGIVSAIAGAVGGPVVKILLQYAVNQQVTQLAGAIAVEQATQEFVDKLRVNANPAKLPQSVLLIMRGVIEGHLDSRGAIIADTPHQIAQAFNMPPDVEEAIGFESPFEHAPTLPWHKPDGSTYLFPASWFILTNLGLFLPWNSAEMIGADYQATVNLRARAARCMSLFNAMVQPLSPFECFQRGRYLYRNKVYGDILGDFFPPTEEDSHYIASDGTVYEFDGRIKNVASIHAAQNTLINPAAIDIPGIVPEYGSDAATSGPGEYFDAPPSLPLTSSPPSPVAVTQAPTGTGVYVRKGGTIGKIGEIDVNG